MKKDQLFLLPYAGGNAYSYQFMLPHLSSFETVCLELPGRGKRIGEPLLHCYQNALDDLFSQIISKRNGNSFVIYGHSMGAQLGLSVTHKLEAKLDAPVALVVTGNAGPGRKATSSPRHKLPQAEFISALKKLGGIPKELFENKEFFEFFEPILRADFEILENGKPNNDTFVKSPIYAVMGQNEPSTQFIEGWQKHTSSSFNYEIWSGNHFFIHDHPVQLSNLIKASLHPILVC